ncbi:SigB/SigF/SigG family RNA polymerase sigma factor [Streptomyces fructofermentans]|uniref:RNA polymerase sigma factor n=1 Tax=Streptomyces fructofermentans TaxID=152141 RepID=A0A918NMN8_9ACTN|nr:SigB/SigF/SigG family RNA polymerase sigma factor [Streptomyces fructofermentans]GGX81322.1 RNA polymerase sigma factor [Streptomyces fructofermentans]
MVSDTMTCRAHPRDTAPPPGGAAGAARRHTPPPAGAAALFARLVDLDDGPEREAVRADLVDVWLPMAYRIAGRFRNRGEDIDDLRQVAALGLVKAIDHFDPGRGAFESYAVPTITGEVRRHFRDRLWAVHVPRRVQTLRNQVRLARRELIQRPGSAEPTALEVAARTDLTLEEVAAGLEALESYSSLSLDAELTTADGFSLVDTLGSIDPSYQLAIDREAVKKGLRRLPERERTILYLRFFEDMTQARIAQRLGLSQMHVCRLLARSCAQVRNEALDHPGDERTAT